jgi:hypothetical protein
MAQADWAVMGGSADGTGWSGVTILRGATFGITPPPGGGLACFGFNCVQKVDSGVGIVPQVVGFAPMPSGGQITGAMQRGLSGGAAGFSGGLFLCASGATLGDTAYILGIEDSSPGRIVLAKGAVSVGIPADGVGTKILRASGVRIAQAEWIHLRLDAIVQASGDVVLRAYTNNMVSHPLDNPPGWIWEPIVFDDGWVGQFSDGYFIDDAIGVNSGSVPLASGYPGFCFKTKEAGRRYYFDHIGLTQQA